MPPNWVSSSRCKAKGAGETMLTAGHRMPGWFDLSTLDKLTDSAHDDEKGMLASVKAVDGLIQAEVDAGIPESRIIVGGFSQGGAISILTGLTSKRKLGGVIGLSCWVTLNHKIQEVSTHNRLGGPTKSNMADGS